MGIANTIRFSALLLAGGQGSRLAGKDKGLMPWRGQPVAAGLSATLRQLTDDVMISCNRNEAIYRQWSDRLVADDAPDYPGPLAGMLAGLRACRGSHLMTVACDMPLVDTDLLKQLLVQAQEQPDIPCLVRAGEQWHPLLTVIPRTLLPALQVAWDEGQRSPLRWLLRQPHAVLQLAAGEPRLHNANTLADWSVHS